MNRRSLLRTTFGVSALFAASSATLVRAVEAACAALGKTHAQTEGPYYKANPPQRASLREADADGKSTVNGELLVVTGRVLDGACQPIANAKLDFWHADADGDYDNEGYRLRGYQMTDAKGRFRLETILPAVYAGRTRHVHVKLTPPGHGTAAPRTLTTQLYFPGEAENARNDLFDKSLMMKVSQSGRERIGEYEFVVEG